MRIDLHVHSNVSPCSVLTPAEILAHARDKGLDGVCITDHDSKAILAQISEGFQPDGLLLLVGMEYTTRQGDFLVFGVEQDLPRSLHAKDLMTLVSDLGGAVVAAHPCRGWRPADPSLLGNGLCSIVEVENGRNTPLENEQARLVAEGARAVTVAGSDAHSLDELGTFPTEFTVPVRSMRDLVDALNSGQCLPAVERRKAS